MSSEFILYPTIDEFECPRYKCKDCIHFEARLPSNDYKGCTHRFDHSKMEYAHHWFVSCPEENGPICSDFEPNGLYKAALPYWHGIDHYLEWKKRQDIEFLGKHYHEKEGTKDLQRKINRPFKGYYNGIPKGIFELEERFAKENNQEE